MAIHLKLLRLLADGRFHSGEALGAALGVSRAAVWKAVQSVQALGCDVHAVRGKGYRLVGGVELLDGEAIRRALPAGAEPLMNGLEIHAEIDSTNRYLMASPESAHGRLCLAESQSAGRGRRGRTWVSPPGCNIYMSVGWEFNEGPSRLSGLSLAAAVAVVRAFEAVGIHGAGVKWPNDVLWGDGKLAGILLEMSGESNGPCRVVIGAGVNIGMPAPAGEGIDQRWTDAKRIAPGVGRNRLAGAVSGELLLMITQFTEHGFEGFRDEWQRRDVLAEQEVVVHYHDRILRGRAEGVEGSGALVVTGKSGRHVIQSGEVSLRRAPLAAV